MTLTPPDMLCFALHSASHAMHAAYAPLLQPLGLTYPQYLVLTSLASREGQTVGQLGAGTQAAQQHDDGLAHQRMIVNHVDGQFKPPFLLGRDYWPFQRASYTEMISSWPEFTEFGTKSRLISVELAVARWHRLGTGFSRPQRPPGDRCSQERDASGCSQRGQAPKWRSGFK